MSLSPKTSTIALLAAVIVGIALQAAAGAYLGSLFHRVSTLSTVGRNWVLRDGGEHTNMRMPSTVNAFSTTNTPPTYPQRRTFTTSTTMASSSKTDVFIDAMALRRSIYQLNNKSPISDDRIVEIVNQAVLHVPSSFNSQSARLVVLLKKEHEQFWDFVAEVLKPLVPAENFGATEQKLQGFRAAYGTILFFECPADVRKLQEQYPMYSDKFPQWSEHTSAMHQYALWTALSLEGFGANLQHYNPVIDQKAQEHWNIPIEWSLKAQLVFGGKAGEAGQKQQKSLEERVKVFGK